MHVHVLYNWQNQCEGGPATVGQLRPLEVVGGPVTVGQLWLLEVVGGPVTVLLLWPLEVVVALLLLDNCGHWKWGLTNLVKDKYCSIVLCTNQSSIVMDQLANIRNVIVDDYSD